MNKHAKDGLVQKGYRQNEPAVPVHFTHTLI